jgi:hypothetical protein
MMRFRLRTLLIVLAILPALMAVGWREWHERVERQKRLRMLRPLLDIGTVLNRRWTEVGPHQSFDPRQLMGQWTGHRAQPTQAEIEATIRRSAVLGAPQPKLLPPGYGEQSH